MKLAFYFSIYQDELLAVRLVSQLREFYPSSQVVAITDGPSRNDRAKKYLSANATLVETKERLKTPGYGGLFTDRNLNILTTELDTDTDLVFKLDPDSYVWRKFNYFPNAHWFGGTFVDTVFNNPCCAGGCWGMRYGAVLQLYESGLLTHDILKGISYDRYTKARNKKGDLHHKMKQVTREDVLVGWAMSQLEIVPCAWDEVYLRQSGEVTQAPTPVAVTHPVRSYW